nr:hypothetical protein [Cognataquiflexum rubidum]
MKVGNNLQKEDITHLIKLHESFPFFQVPKVLLSKYEFEKSAGKSKELLNWAAITSPDRAWLKLMVESDVPFRFLENKIVENMETFSNFKPNNQKNIVLEGFEKSLVPEPTKETDPELRAKILKKLEENLNSRKDQQVTQSIEEPVTPPKPKKRRVNDDLIENIRKREKKEIVDEKKKEQIDLIKAFSKREFKLATLKEMEDFQKQADLSENSTHLHPTLLSESYAKLLVKQGKKQKAKEIYQKLMVKFPDKSIYFADLIKGFDLQ